MIYKCFICNSLKQQIYNCPHRKAIQDIFKDKGTTMEIGKKKSCIKHGVDCDFSKLITKNNNFRKGAMKNEDSHSFTISQPFNLAPNLKQYVFAKLFPKKLIVLIESNCTTTLDIAIDPHMVVIQIHVRKNLVEDVLLDG